MARTASRPVDMTQGHLIFRAGVDFQPQKLCYLFVEGCVGVFPLFRAVFRPDMFDRSHHVSEGPLEHREERCATIDRDGTERLDVKTGQLSFTRSPRRSLRTGLHRC